MAYNRDLQEDKIALFDAHDTVSACLELAAAIVAGAELQTEQIAERLEEGFLDATALMEYLIKKDIPQRTAHHLVGTLVRAAMDRSVRLADLELEAFQDLHPDVDESVYDVLGVERVVEAFVSAGSTAPAQVESQVTKWKNQLGL